MKMFSLARATALTAALVLAACTVAPPQAPVPPVAARTAAQMLAAVQKAAGQDDRELTVQPLRDPEVEDLRESAAAAVSRQDLMGAAQSLDRALVIVPEDPAVLQERAEVALRQAEFDLAERFALHATELGSATGPLCRRHWETVRQVRERRLEIARAPLSRPDETKIAEQSARVAHLATTVAEAGTRFDACTVPGINRM